MPSAAWAAYWAQGALDDLALIIAVFWLVNIYEEHLTDRFLPHGDPEAFDAYRKASFSNLEMYWNVVLGFFMTGANTGIKLIYPFSAGREL